MGWMVVGFVEWTEEDASNDLVVDEDVASSCYGLAATSCSTHRYTGPCSRVPSRLVVLLVLLWSGVGRCLPVNASD